MPRTRLINPAASLDEDVAALSIWARHLWAYLPCHADREGRLKDSAFMLKASIFPADTIDVDALIGELAATDMVVRYQVDGKRYLQIRNFAKYQSPHKNEVPSDIPPVPLAKLPERSSNYPSARSHPVSDPDPVSGSGDDPVGESVPPAPDLSGMAALAIWSSHDWLSLFKRMWGVRYNRLTYGQGTEDARATGDFGDMLSGLPDAERLEAQIRAAAMISAYLADDSPGRVKASHPWKWFVAGFNALRAATGPPGADKKSIYADITPSRPVKAAS